MSSIYEGKRNSMKVYANTSGNMTFKIPADGDKTSLVTLSEGQCQDLMTQISDHLDAPAPDLTETRNAIQTQIDTLSALRGDHSDAIGALQDALDVLV